MQWLTFIKNAQGLSSRKNGLDIDTNAALGAVLAPHNGKAQAFTSWTFFKFDCLYGVLGVVVATTTAYVSTVAVMVFQLSW